LPWWSRFLSGQRISRTFIPFPNWRSCRFSGKHPSFFSLKSLQFPPILFTEYQDPSLKSRRHATHFCPLWTFLLYLFGKTAPFLEGTSICATLPRGSASVSLPFLSNGAPKTPPPSFFFPFRSPFPCSEKGSGEQVPLLPPLSMLLRCMTRTFKIRFSSWTFFSPKLFARLWSMLSA